MFSWLGFLLSRCGTVARVLNARNDVNYRFLKHALGRGASFRGRVDAVYCKGHLLRIIIHGRSASVFVLRSPCCLLCVFRYGEIGTYGELVRRSGLKVSDWTTDGLDAATFAAQ